MFGLDRRYEIDGNYFLTACCFRNRFEKLLSRAPFEIKAKHSEPQNNHAHGTSNYYAKILKYNYRRKVCSGAYRLEHFERGDRREFLEFLESDSIVPTFSVTCNRARWLRVEIVRKNTKRNNWRHA